MAVLARSFPSLSVEPLVRAVTFDGLAAAIVRREVGLMLQQRAFRVLVLGLTAVNLMIAYAQFVDPFENVDVELAVRKIVLVQGLMLYAIGFVFTAARAGTCIGTERARDTWQLMWLAPAHPISIALGHIAAALAPAVLLTLSQLPVMAPAVYAIGAEEWPNLAYAAAIAVTSWVACAAWAFWASAQFLSFGRALAGAFIAAVWSSGILTAMLVGTLVLFSAWNSATGVPSFYAADLLRIASPVMQLYYVISSGYWSVPLISHIVFMLAAALIPLLMGARAIRRWRESAIPAPRKRLSERLMISAARHDSGIKEIFDRINPIFAVERRIAAAGRSRTVIILFVVFSALALYVSVIVVANGLGASAEALLSTLFLLAFGIGAWSTATGTAASQERQTFDMVAMTGLRARDIQRGKVLAALMGVFPLVAVLAACVVLLGIMTEEHSLALATLVTLLLCIATLMSSGLFASVVAPGMREAVVSNILIGLVMFFGVPILCLSVILGIQGAVRRNWLGLQRWIAPEFVNLDRYNIWANGSSPLTGLMQLLDDPSNSRSWALWSASVLVALAWTALWYTVAGRILERKLCGQPAWRS